MNKSPDPALLSGPVCHSCGQKFSFWQRFAVSHNSRLQCKNCHTTYQVFIEANTGKISGLGGGLCGVAIIGGYLLADHYHYSPYWGLAAGILTAFIIVVYVYKYTWRRTRLLPQKQ